MTKDLSKTHFVEADDIYITPRGRMNFVALANKFTPRGRGRGSDDGQYVVSICFPPTVDLKLLKDAANKAAKEEFGADLFVPGKSKSVKNPFLNPSALPSGGDVIFPDPENNGEPMDLSKWTMIRTNAKKRRPVVRNAQGEVIEGDDLDIETYSGRWARLMVRAAAYDVETEAGKSKGVKFYLEGVQLLKHDLKTGSAGGTTGEAFGAVDDEEDDPLA